MSAASCTSESRVKVPEIQEDGVLTKVEIREILEMSTNPEMTLPLESKYWSRQQLEMFVMSGGAMRPRNCSMPDERLMANATMSEEDVSCALSQAAAWIDHADALLIGSGAGMGVESGLGTFRGATKGVWQGLEDVGLAYEEICHPRWFEEEPNLAWGFWNFCHEAYQSTPHSGYRKVRQWGQKAPLGCFSFTSNIDSHWTASGFDSERVIEIHGAVKWLQCSKPCCADVWRAPKDLKLVEDAAHRVRGTLPVCPKCKAVARPNVQMFGGDANFSKARRSAQLNRYEAWLKKLESRPDYESLRLACVELGCGLTVPTVRKELENVLQRFPSARLIRINPENPGLMPETADKGVSVPLAAGVAIDDISKRFNVQPLATFILWDQRGGGAEMRAPLQTSVGRLIRLSEMHGVLVEMSKSTSADVMVGNHSEHVTLERTLHVKHFNEVKATGKEFELTAVLQLRDAIFVNGPNSVLQSRIDSVGLFLDDVNRRFGDAKYQEEVQMCNDRRSVMRMVRRLQNEVLPLYGMEASERGAVVMAQWISTIKQKDIFDKIALSMHLSFVSRMEHLPVCAGSVGKFGTATAWRDESRHSDESTGLPVLEDVLRDRGPVSVVPHNVQRLKPEVVEGTVVEKSDDGLSVSKEWAEPNLESAEADSEVLPQKPGAAVSDSAVAPPKLHIARVARMSMERAAKDNCTSEALKHFLAKHPDKAALWSELPDVARLRVWCDVIASPLIRTLGPCGVEAALLNGGLDLKAVSNDPVLRKLLADSPALIGTLLSAGLVVTLTKLGTHAQAVPVRFSLRCPTRTTVKEMRKMIGERCALDANTSKKIRLLFRTSSGFVTGRDAEKVNSDMLVTNLEKWPR